MNNLLFELIRPSPAPLPPNIIEHLSEDATWSRVCSTLHRSGLAPLVYEQTQRHGWTFPTQVVEWLRAQHDLTGARNAFLLDELNKMTVALQAEGIPVLVLKGPILAHFGTGLSVRPFNDLDLLVKRCDLTRAVPILKSMGFVELGGDPHDYHRTLVRPRPRFATVVDIHFDLFDRQHAYAPDLIGIWNRSIDLNISGGTFQAPGLTDHLLLAIMQLPHHLWDPRVIVDIGYIIYRWEGEIDWKSLEERARSWGMRALTGSVLYAVESCMLVTVPRQFRAFLQPAGYFHRVQWHIVRRAVVERFGPTPELKLARVAPYLAVDRIGDLIPLLRQRVVPRVAYLSRTSRTSLGRYLMTCLSVVPPLLAVLARAATPAGGPENI